MKKRPKHKKFQTSFFFLSEKRSSNISHSINQVHEVCFAANHNSLTGWGNFSETHFEQSLFSRFSPYFVPQTKGKYEGNSHFSLIFNFITNLEIQTRRCDILFCKTHDDKNHS